MKNLILGCADSIQAHEVYADFLEDNGTDTSFFRLFLQMRRNPSYGIDIFNWDIRLGEGISVGFGDGFNNIKGMGWGQGSKHDDGYHSLCNSSD